MPYSQTELNAANKAEAVAARLAVRTARAAQLRARWLKLGGEPADFTASETTLLRRDLEEQLFSSAGRSVETGVNRDTPETSLT